MEVEWLRGCVVVRWSGGEEETVSTPRMVVGHGYDPAMEISHTTLCHARKETLTRERYGTTNLTAYLKISRSRDEEMELNA